MAAARTCKLELWFTGLCMFVPSGDDLWVLMPDAIKCGVATVHKARLLYWGALTAQFDLPSVKDAQVDLLSVATPASRRLPADIVKPGTLAGGVPVKDECISPAPGLPDYLAARVRLPRGIGLVPCNVAELNYGGVIQRTAGAACVTFPNFELERTNTFELAPGIELAPKGGRIVLLVANLPETEYAGIRSADDRMTHFRAYHKLLSGEPPLTDPDYWQGTPDLPCSGCPFPNDPSQNRGMDPYTCMISGGCPDGSDSC